MSNYTVLITGASRGLGLEFTKQYAADGWQVLACCRDMKSAEALKSLASLYENIQIYRLDVSDFNSITSLATQLKEHAIDLLINNAGVYPDSRLGDTSEIDWLEAFKINTIAPMKMAEAFNPHIAKSQLKKLVTLSSKMGSVDDNSGGGSYIYRSSKCAVNMVMKSLSIDLKKSGITVLTLHPGWVQTDMGGPNGLIDAPTSVTGMRHVIDDLTLSNTGKFIAFDGKPVPW